MKKLLISALAIASMVACSKDEVVDQQLTGSAIGFEQSFVDNATRAAVDPSITTETLGAFDVWGFMDETDGTVFDQERVTKQDNGAWTYGPLQYWLPNHTYYFAAIAPVNSNNWTVDATGANTYGVGVVKFTNVDGTEDLLYSAAEVSTVGKEVTDNYDKVAFTFHHLLSKVKFSFTNGFASNKYSIEVKNIKMTAPGDATIELSVENWWDNDDWKLGATSTVLAFGDMNNGERLGASLKAESTYERLTIPASAGQEYVVTFDVTLYQGNQVAYTNALSTTINGAALEMGKAYNFHATLDQTNVAGNALKPIEFTVTEVKEWVDGDGYDGGKVDTEVVGVASAKELADAIAEGATNFRLLENINGPLTFDGVTRAAAVEYTLDLNNKTISAAEDAITVSGGILNIVGNGLVEAATSMGEPFCAVWAYNNAVVNIYGGEYKIGYPEGDYNDLIYAKESATINIYGGQFHNSGKEDAFVLNLKDADRATAHINVYGGSYEKFNPANNASENPGHSFLAAGYISKQEGEWYTVYPETQLQEVSNETELQTALNAGGTNIVLVANIETSQSLIVNDGVSAVVDLNGYNITNVTENDELGMGDAIIVYGDLTINGEGTVSGYTRSVWARSTTGATVTINSGNFVGAQTTCEVIYASGDGQIFINGGTFQAVVEDPTSFAKPQYAVLNLHGNGKTGCDIVVRGGRFYRFNPSDNISENPKHNFVAEGYVSKAVDANWFEVVEE